MRDGRLELLPVTDWFGDATITYAIDDGHGGTATAHAAITVRPVNNATVIDLGSVTGTWTAGDRVQTSAGGSFTILYKITSTKWAVMRRLATSLAVSQTITNLTNPGGTATITAVTLASLQNFTLDMSDALVVNKVSVNGRRPAHFRSSGGKLHIALAAPLPAGAALSVAVRYGGSPRPVRTVRSPGRRDGSGSRCGRSGGSGGPRGRRCRCRSGCRRR